MSRKLRIGCSPLTKTIYAGTIGKDGKTWLSDRTDVTTEALIAVAEHIGPGFFLTLEATNGGPSLQIEVRKIPPQPTAIATREGGR